MDFSQWIEEDLKKRKQLEKEIKALQKQVPPIITEEEIDAIYKVLGSITYSFGVLKKESMDLDISYDKLKTLLDSSKQIEESRKVLTFLLEEKEISLNEVEEKRKNRKNSVDTIGSIDSDMRQMARSLDYEAARLRKAVSKDFDKSESGKVGAFLLTTVIVGSKLKTNKSLLATALESYLLYKVLESLLTKEKESYEAALLSYQEDILSKIQEIGELEGEIDKNYQKIESLKTSCESEFASYMELPLFKDLFYEIDCILGNFQNTKQELNGTRESLKNSYDMSKVKTKKIEQI